MLPFARIILVIHVVCRYRLLSLLPAHPTRPLLVILQWLAPSSWRRLGHLSEGERLQLALQQLGPIFIKFGQLLATRQDMLPKTWTDQLALLQDKVAPFPGDQAMEMVAAQLQQPISAVFATFDQTPMAAASIAQVHAATLIDGRQVVAKVRRPDIMPVVERDIQVMLFGARMLEKLWGAARYFQPLRVVEDYRDIIFAELDLSAEARNSETMRRHFLFSPLLYIPEIHLHLSTDQLIVMDRIHGIPVNDIERIKAAGIDPKTLAERGVEIFFAQVFRHNFFHADMHPGNIFVNPEHPQSPQYMAIDCAIAGRLSKTDLNILGRMVLAVMREDYNSLIDTVIRAGWAQAPVDRQRFERDVVALVEPVRNADLSEIEFAPMVMQLLDLARSYKIKMPVQYVLLIKTLVHIEGLGRSIYPRLDIWSTGRPLVEAWMVAEYGPSATLQKVQQKLPEWIANLPEMPDLLRDSLEALQHLPQQQRDQEQRLQQAMARHRTKLVTAVTGVGALFAALYADLPGDLETTTPLLIGGIVALFWALRR